ncbi:hypothetical protein Bca101_042614 [Brassica carinata]
MGKVELDESDVVYVVSPKILKRRRKDREREEVEDGFKDDFSLDLVSEENSHLLS